LSLGKLFRSTECVEHLIRTIVSATNSLKLSQQKEARLAQDLALSQAQLFPLRKENAALARESHQLHEENIKCREDFENFKSERLNNEKSLQDRVNELIYLCKSKDSYIAKVEADLERVKNVGTMRYIDHLL
jgi:septal ring factor EnvC (AmiA/AmiB activator)